MRMSISNLGAIVRINGHSLCAALCAGLAWWLWQIASPQWWPLYAAAILCAIGALAAATSAVRLMHKIYVREKIVRRYFTAGDGRTGSRLAEGSDLEPML